MRREIVLQAKRSDNRQDYITNNILLSILFAALGVGEILSLYDPLKPALLRFLHGAQA